MNQNSEKSLKASVIVPVYNGSHVIGECLKALQNQSLPAEKFEVIVVDDGSTDNSFELVRQFPVNPISMVHSGPACARNKGAGLARGDILVFTDADCAPERDWLKKMLAPFDDPDVVGVKGAYLTSQLQTTALFTQLEFETRYAMLRTKSSIDFVDTYSGAFRREVFREVGGFDPDFPVANNEDVDLSYRISALGKRMVFAPEARVYHRHPCTWLEYAKVKFWRGYWRMAVYKRFAGKAVSDSYTPQALKLQILALAGFLGSLPFAVMTSLAFIFSIAFMGLFIVACIPFYRVSLRIKPALVFVLPIGLIIRSAALGLGICLGLIRPPVRNAHERHMTAVVFMHMFLDICVLAASFGLSFWLRITWLKSLITISEPACNIPWTGITCVCLWFFVLYVNRTYLSQRVKSLSDHVANIILVNIESLAVLAVFLFVFNVSEICNSLVGLFVIISTVLLSGEKVILYSVLKKMRARGLNVKRVLLVGKRVNVLDPLRRFISAADAGFSVVGILSSEKDEIGEKVLNVPVLGSIADMERILHEVAVDEVFFTIPFVSVVKLEQSLSICFRMGIQGKLIADIFEGMATSSNILGMPFLSFLPHVKRRRDMFVKRAIDVVVSFILLLVLFPFMLIIALLIKTTTNGQMIFKQKRMGLNGRIFMMYKFRTMIASAESLQEQAGEGNVMDGPVFKNPNDPRITPVGRWLRRLSIDELPQLWNVAIGEMSLVGPRPLPVYEAKEIYGDLRRRVSMKPGMTGLWQCSGRNEVNFDEWMKLDLTYVDHWSLWLDIKTLFKTCWILIKRTGAS